MANLRPCFQFWRLLVAIVFLERVIAEDVSHYSEICRAWISDPDAVEYDNSVIDTAFIIMPLHNPNPDLLNESIKSIMMNSVAANNYQGSVATVFLNELLIIDDVSDNDLQ